MPELLHKYEIIEQAVDEYEVRSCPFCGSDDLRIGVTENTICCNYCRCIGPRPNRIIRSNIELWNMRPNLERS